MKKFVMITIPLILCIILTFSCCCTNSHKVIAPVSNSNLTGNLTITYIDVGQGDSELIISPSGKTMLIDAGESEQSSKIVSVMKKQSVVSFNDVVMTHPHSDHIGGIFYIISNYPVYQIIDSGYPHTTKTYANILDLIDKRNISYRVVRNGDVLDFDPNVKVEVSNPQNTWFENINDNSVVLKITYGDVSFLLPGDAEGDAEKVYATQLDHIDILKVGHHGSKTSTSDYLLNKIYPDVSIISVGKDNSYGHPSIITLNKLAKSHSEIYRTDVNGDITITTDGNTYSVVTERS
jgi:competence protein ComEC